MNGVILKVVKRKKRYTSLDLNQKVETNSIRQKINLSKQKRTYTRVNLKSKETAFSKVPFW